MQRFEGLTALLTGATGGFGRRTAERLAAEGANLVLSDIGEDTGDAFAAIDPARFVYHPGDVSDEKTSEALVQLAVERFGRLDIAYNNAGIAHDSVRLPQIGADVARRVLEIDLLAVFFAMKHQIPVMERQFHETGRGGVIVNTASVAGLAGAPKLSVYAAAKHGVVGLTRSAAAEYATKGVRVNAVCPSFARTDMAMDFIRAAPVDQAAAEADMTRGVPMKRLAEVDEVVEVMLFAADPKNSFMTGQAYAVDGGITAI